MSIWEQWGNQSETLSLRPQTLAELESLSNDLRQEGLFGDWAPQTAVLDISACSERCHESLEDILRTIGTIDCFSGLILRDDPWRINISPLPVRVITGCLRETRERLVSLRIEDCSLATNEDLDELQQFEQAMSNMNQLKTLDFTPRYSREGKLAVAISKLPMLHTLRMKVCDLSLVQHFWGSTSLRALSIYRGYIGDTTNLTDDDTRQIATALEASTYLETLEFKDINSDQAGMQELLECLSSGIAKSSSLKTVLLTEGCYSKNWLGHGKWEAFLTNIAKGLSNNSNSVLNTIKVESRRDNFYRDFEPAFAEMLRSDKGYSFTSLELFTKEHVKYLLKDKHLNLHLRLNGTGMGRKSYMARSLTLKEGTDILASFSSDIDCVFHCLQTQPWLCQATNEPMTEQDGSEELKRDSLHLDSKPAAVKKARIAKGEQDTICSNKNTQN